MVIVLKKQINDMELHAISLYKQTLYNHQVRIPWHIDFQPQPVSNQIVKV